MNDLPIQSSLPALRNVLAAGPTAVLTAPAGSGKTTGAPLALLDEPWLKGRNILILEPRRLAARMAAARMAEMLDEPVGRTVGYRVRFDSKVSAATRIEILTEGILTRRLQHDSALEGVGLVIFDEFHERSLQADLALALCLDVLKGLREDLRLLVMSATLDTGRVAALLGNAPVVTGKGYSHPVAVQYLAAEPGNDMAAAVVAGIRRALAEQSGDILAFLPGVGEIRAVAGRLAPLADETGIIVAPLFGDLSRAAQDHAVLPRPDGRRRVVLATSVAETSLTIEGITTVVDSGWARLPHFDANNGLTRLKTVRVSRASAQQRKGRAGRLGPGACYRLWTEATQHGLLPFKPPEITAADLAPLALMLAQWGVYDPSRLAWLDPPPPGAFAQGLRLLRDLDALDQQGRITSMGKRMADLPLHPRLAHMLLRAEELGAAPLACDLAALFSERDILKSPGAARPTDIDARLRILDAFRSHGPGAALALDGDPAACRQVDRSSSHWQRFLTRKHGKKIQPAIGILLALAYPDRIAQVRPGSRSQYLLANGRGARLPTEDTLCGSGFLIAPQLDAGQKEGRIFLAAPLDEDELRSTQATRINTVDRIDWDDTAEAVTARRETRLGALVLEQHPLDKPEPAAVLRAMLTGIRRMGTESLPWNKPCRDLQGRILSLRHWLPDEQWPDVSDPGLMERLDDWLGPYLDNIRRREHLRDLNLADILQNSLDWQARQRLDAGAPTHIPVPSGRRLRLQYDPGHPPVLAVKLQEMFGLADTPTVCWGKVPVMLHLLSPAQRPIQVTQDLSGFWNSTYFAVKKELAGRYPKHPWPDDPWSANPSARAKQRPRKPSSS